MRCLQFVGIVLLLLDEGAPREIRRKRLAALYTRECPPYLKRIGNACVRSGTIGRDRPSITSRAFNNFHKKESIPEDIIRIPSPAAVADVLHELDAREVDQVGSTVELDNQQAKVVRPNIALLVSDKPVRGLQVSSIGQNSFRNESFNFLNETLEPNSEKEIGTNKESELVVILPPSVTKERRVSFVVFRNESLFRSKQIGYTVNSLVISVNIENVSRFDGEEVIDIYFRSIMKPAKNQSVTCAYWHFLEDDTGYWCQDGCTFIRATQDGMLDTCRCNHLTHFAELLVSKVVFTKMNENTLELLTIAGCSLSIMGLIVVGATALLFRSWRKKYTNKIWLNLCMAILVLDASFLLAIFVHYDVYHMKCLLLGVTLHYAVLASFCWMLVAAVMAYRQLVLVFSLDVPHMILKAAAFAWGAPVVVVGMLLSVSKVSYAGRLHVMTPGGTFCYPTGLGLWLAVIAPILVILVTNWTLLALIIHSVFLTKKNKNYGERNEALRCISVSCTLVFLFGLPWVSGLFASDVVAAYLFTSTATFQGFILFIFFVIGNQETRNLWINKIFKKQK